MKTTRKIKLALAASMALALAGCAFGGAHVDHVYHLVFPGSTVEVVEGKVKVRTPGSNDVQEDFDAAGYMLLPKSTYRMMREAYVQLHPDAGSDDKHYPGLNARAMVDLPLGPGAGAVDHAGVNR